MKLLIEDKFPTIDVRTTKGDMTLPDEFAGHWFVFFSHPGDFTPVCTTEFVGFQKRAEAFAALNTKLIGLSVDDIEDHRAWVKWIRDNLQVGVEFPIIDDKDRSVSLQLGMLRPDQTAAVTARSVIVVDDRGVVRTILEYPKELGRNIDEVVRIVKGLQLFDTIHLMAPANWPHNEIIGDKVLVPPSAELTDAEIAEQHVTQLSDWFRYRELV
jgi:peroxiredoxin (alkyl hydroperoxide reductase subunit C)